MRWEAWLRHDMRILSVNQDPGISPERKKGAAIHLRAMREAFRALGAEVIPVDSPDPTASRAAVLAAGSVDLVYERYSLSSGPAAALARELGVPFVLEVNAPLEDEERRYREGETDGDVAPSPSFRDATLVVAVSKAVARYAVCRGAPTDRVRVVPNAVDVERFRPRAPDDRLRDELVPRGRVAIGFHGRLRPWHGFGMLVRTFARLLDRNLPLHLLIVGEGDFDADLEGKLPPERVTRVPWVDHALVGRYVACFDVLPLTYDPDAPCYFSPLKLAEAMAAGVVPVVPDLGDLTSIVRDGENGLVYPAGSATALSARIEALVLDGEERARMAARASADAASRTWVDVAREILDAALGAETS